MSERKKLDTEIRLEAWQSLGGSGRWGIGVAVDVIDLEDDMKAVKARLAALEQSSRPVQPATETAAAGANDPGRGNEASDGPGDGWRRLHAPYDSPRLGDERRDCMSNPKGPWVPLSESDVGEWLPWAEYRRRITPVEAVPHGGLVYDDSNYDATTGVMTPRETGHAVPDDAGRRLVAGEDVVTLSEFNRRQSLAEIARLTAERDAARAEVERHKMTREERNAATVAAAVASPPAPFPSWRLLDNDGNSVSVSVYAGKLRGYLDRTKEGE